MYNTNTFLTSLLFTLILSLPFQHTFSQSYVGLTFGANRAGFTYNHKNDQAGYHLKSKKPKFGFMAGLTGIAKIENTIASLKFDINYNRINSFIDYHYSQRIVSFTDSARLHFNFIDLSLSLDLAIEKKLGIHYFIGFQNHINFLSTATTIGTKKNITRDCNQISAGLFTGFRVLFNTKFLPKCKILTDISYFYDFYEIYHVFHLNGFYANAGVVYTLPFKIF